MSFESFVGFRFLKPKRQQLLISVIGLISIVGVTVGVATLIVVISVISGFQDFMQTKSLEAFSHMLVLSYNPSIPDYKELIEQIKKYDGVEAVSPFVYGEVMIASETGVSGSILRGVDPNTVVKVTSLGKNMKLGRVESITEEHPVTISTLGDGTEQTQKLPGILLGDELAASLHVVKGMVVRVVTPMGDATPMGVMPKMARFVVTGIFSSGLLEFDAKFAYISIPQAQKFFNTNGVTGLEVRFNDIWKATTQSQIIANDLGWPYRTKDWVEMNRALYSALKLEKLAMFIVVSLIMFVAALNIFSTLYMLVMDKKKSIAILKTMGASDKSILRIFLYQGLMIGWIGSVGGFLLGVGLCLLQMKYTLVPLDPEVYMVAKLPMKFKIFDFMLIAGAAFVYSFVATYVPARIAARFEPVSVIRYE